MWSRRACYPISEQPFTGVETTKGHHQSGVLPESKQHWLASFTLGNLVGDIVITEKWKGSRRTAERKERRVVQSDANLATWRRWIRGRMPLFDQRTPLLPWDPTRTMLATRGPHTRCRLSWTTYTGTVRSPLQLRLLGNGPRHQSSNHIATHDDPSVGLGFVTAVNLPILTRPPSVAISCGPTKNNMCRSVQRKFFEESDGRDPSMLAALAMSLRRSLPLPMPVFLHSSPLAAAPRGGIFLCTTLAGSDQICPSPLNTCFPKVGRMLLCFSP